MANKNVLIPVGETSLGGINLYVNPLKQPAGVIYRAVNVDSFPYFAKKKRPGYSTFLGTADGSAVKDLWAWNNNGTLNLYRNSGTQIFSSQGGTGAWTAMGNGSVAGTAHFGQTVLGSVMIGGDGVGSTRHTTDGTSWTNTTLAPVSQSFEQYQNRIYAGGTASTLFYSTTGDATNWALSGTSDSSSITIPGAGTNLRVFKLADRLFTTKTSQAMFRWDGFSLVDTATALGPSSAYSYGTVEGNGFWLNPLGIFTSNGGKPQIISNAIQRQIYNDSGSAIASGTFSTAPGVVHRYDYLLAAGTLTDDFSNQTINDAIIKYDYQKNEFLNWRFNNFPTAFCSYKDANGAQQLIFGDKNGQCYQLAGTANTDNGVAIEAQLEGFIHLGTLLDKEWNWFRASFNPGCMAKVSICVENTFNKGEKSWRDLGDARSGVVNYKFKQGDRGKFLFWKIYDSSKNARFDFYGFEVDADIVQAG